MPTLNIYHVREYATVITHTGNGRRSDGDGRQYYVPAAGRSPVMGSGPLLGRFDRPTADSRTRIALLADLHLSTSATGTWRVSHRTAERLERAVESINGADLDAVVFVGDLVQSGAREEYEALDRLLADIEPPLLAVPGNHDLFAGESEPKLSLGEFERRYTPGSLPFHERIGGVDLVGLSSNASTPGSLTDSYSGRLSESTLDWLADRLSDIEDPLVAVHHNLPGSRSFLFEAAEAFPVDAASPVFENADTLVSVLRDAPGDPLVCTGHVHFPSVTRTRGVREFTLPALGPYPASYTVLEIDPSGTTARLVPVADHGRRLEALESGLENARVLLAAAQLAGLPLTDGCRGDGP